MRLRQIEIFGFKSFAQKVQIPFGPGITAIVGPNGCGKSNVVEAIRWVLGEQRAGFFRSHRMDEVIFSGTGQRQAINMAEVSLTIENSQKILPIEFSEVIITRRLFRSGESDYLLNKIPCRLLDINNLLMDTGLGQGSYAVMEQGMVDEIISEKTENRRRILEEAAGITKYKARRRSTWSKLESTDVDLTRIEDRIAEAKRQVDYLSRKVGQARRYQVLKEELDDLEVRLGRHRFFTVRQQIRPLREELERLERLAQEGSTLHVTREAELEKVRLAVTQAEQAVQEVARQLSQRVEEIHQREGALIQSQERLEAVKQQIERTERLRQDNMRQREMTQEQRQAIAQRSTDTQTQLDEIEQRLETHTANAEEAVQAYTQTRRQVDGYKSDLMRALRHQSELSSSLERLKTERDSLLERSGHLRGEIDRLDTEHEAAQASQAQIGDLLANLHERRETLEKRHQAATQQQTAVRQRSASLEQDRDAWRRALEASQARLQALQKVRSAYEGYSGGVRTLLLESPHRALFTGVLGDLIDVDPALHRAVETALGESLEALVAPTRDGILEAIDYLKNRSGRVAILPLEGLPPVTPSTTPKPAPGLQGPLLDSIRPDAAMASLLENLLHNTFLVDDLESALNVPPTAHPLRLVTPDGDIVDIDGRIAGGSADDEEASLLGRRREILALQARCAGEKARLHALDESLAQQRKRGVIVAAQSEKMHDLLVQNREAEREQTLLQQNAEREIGRLASRLSQGQREIATLIGRQEQLTGSIQTGAEQLQKTEEDAAALEQRIGESEQDLQRDEQASQEQRVQLNALQVQQARLREQVENLGKENQRLAQMDQTLEQNIHRFAEEIEQAGRSSGELASRARDIEAELAGLLEGRHELVEEDDRRRQNWDTVNAQNRQLSETMTQLQRELSTQQERRHQLELELTDLDGQTTYLQQRLQEEQKCDVETMGPLDDETFDAEQAASRIDQLHLSIKRLGPVHLGVLEEYEEQKERFDFFCQHRDDLLAAAADLRKTLNRIDREARQIFLDSFSQIREKFRETYARFFPGGQADLRLQQDVDALEAEIEIIARPRGKQLQSISLLSGGERALTAISLLFAIYLVKPSPFCILDEVDAPLDDNNVSRFVRVLKEFARKTQFAMVTHNKLSMNAADTLHGVTMPEEGVSQIVSVQVDDDILEEAAG